MTLKMIRPGLLLAGAALLTAVPAVVTAQQDQPEGKRFNYGFQLGGRLFLKGVDSLERGKFELYRHIPEAPFGGLRVPPWSCRAAETGRARRRSSRLR